MNKFNNLDKMRGIEMQDGACSIKSGISDFSNVVRRWND